MRVARRPRLLKFLRAQVSLLNCLAIVWVFTVLWIECGRFSFSIAQCGWEDKRLPSVRSSVTHESPEAPYHVFIITDPQVQAPLPPQQGPISRFRHWIYHHSLRKNWVYARSLKPDAIVFLGDMLDGGRRLSGQKQYSQAVEHFREIFSLQTSTGVHFVPGNEDVGLNPVPTDGPQARDFYVRYFGSANKKVTVRNHTFVLLDAPLLVEEDYRRSKTRKTFEEWHSDDDGSVAFVRSSQRRVDPVILFTHIPLARPETASCGPLREHGTIRKGAGPGYQNTLGKLTTQFIMEHIKPSLVFSGDDRDYCEYSHNVTGIAGVPGDSSVREVTVKSFSPDKHIDHPGFHLLSLVTPQSAVDQQHSPDAPTFADSPCFMPSPTTTLYLPFIAMTLLVLLIASLRQPPSRRKSLLPSPILDIDHEYVSVHSATASWPSKLLSRGYKRSPMSPAAFSKERSPIGVPRRSLLHRIIRTLRRTFAKFILVTFPALALWTLIICTL
ncbi:hypothetical protein BDW22DRAFT_1326677 [Trametopsis cervina]|nr:hypothetical protein BDW22DRAFT_1326677 [Trametopsis cervina]